MLLAGWAHSPLSNPGGPLEAVSVEFQGSREVQTWDSWLALSTPASCIQTPHSPQPTRSGMTWLGPTTPVSPPPPLLRVVCLPGLQIFACALPFAWSMPPFPPSSSYSLPPGLSSSVHSLCCTTEIRHCREPYSNKNLKILLSLYFSMVSSTPGG